MFRPRQCLCRGTDSLNSAFAASAGMIWGSSCPRNLGVGTFSTLAEARATLCRECAALPFLFY